MGARNKLNAAAMNGCVLVAGTIGYLTGSWTVFAWALILFVIGSVIAGSIRPTRRGKRR